MGSFCEKFGNGKDGFGTIPDWNPVYFPPNQVVVPYFVPDTEVSRRDIAAQYTAITRLDQGISLIMDELKSRGLIDGTLIMYTSDNGIPFPSGRTNLYDPGMQEPLILSSPLRKHKRKQNTTSDAMVSLLDITPTILDWFRVPYPSYRIFRHSKEVKLSGKSLLSLLGKKSRRRGYARKEVYGSHSFHEVTMYYPQRVVRTRRYKLIHNLNYKMPFPIDQDFYLSPTFDELLNSTQAGTPTHWYKTIHNYYYRDEFELYDVEKDPRELKNIVSEPRAATVLQRLKRKQKEWMQKTNDPWICSPRSVLEAKGKYLGNPQCLPLYNDA